MDVLVLLGKMPVTKNTQEKSLTSIEQSLMAGPNCQAAGERWRSPDSGLGKAFIEEEGLGS
jgi:hypothetical protein